MAIDFYMTLPSNASMEMHPDNTLTHYVTHLPQRIDLTGEWECGLAEVQYPHTWYNVTDNDVWFFLNTIDASMLGFREPVASEPVAVTSSPVLPADSCHPDSSYPFHIEANDVVNLTQGFDTLYLYTDIVESRIVGDTLAPLLRALPISGRHGDRVSARFTNVHNVPLLRSNFTSIEVDIRNDMGRRVPFEYGRVTVTLHFRRRKPGLF